MVVLLAVGGAVAMFAAGWVAGRARQPPEVVRSNPVAQPSDSLYADVLALHPMGVIVASPNGSVEYRNPAASAVGGTHVGVLIDEAVAKHLAAARSGGPSSETIELFGPPKRVIVVSAEPMPSGRSVAFVEDISDRRRAEQARTDFVANVSHELRTPIGALMALADTLEGIDDGDIVARVVSRMQGEADRALLASSKPSSNSPRSRRAPSDTSRWSSWSTS